MLRWPRHAWVLALCAGLVPFAGGCPEVTLRDTAPLAADDGPSAASPIPDQQPTAAPVDNSDSLPPVFQSTPPAKQGCCQVANLLVTDPAKGCDDPAVESCVCLRLPGCCSTAWGPGCVTTAILSCSACADIPLSQLDPGVVAAVFQQLDRDEDGLSDAEEISMGLDPFDPTDGPDVDGDGIPNSEDSDVDEDGEPNAYDRDIDGDGILNLFDDDDDGDGVDDVEDDDDDGDGVEDDVDNDDDADGDDDFEFGTGASSEPKMEDKKEDFNLCDVLPCGLLDDDGNGEVNLCDVLPCGVLDDDGSILDADDGRSICIIIPCGAMDLDEDGAFNICEILPCDAMSEKLGISIVAKPGDTHICDVLDCNLLDINMDRTISLCEALPCDLLDFDHDGVLNGIDDDIDGDNIPNVVDPDMDGDGMPNAMDADMDGDMRDNMEDRDPDGNGDDDNDDDGILDSLELLLGSDEDSSTSLEDLTSTIREDLDVQSDADDPDLAELIRATDELLEMLQHLGKELESYLGESFQSDGDGDNLSDAAEKVFGTNPNRSDRPGGGEGGGGGSSGGGP